MALVFSDVTTRVASSSSRGLLRLRSGEERPSEPSVVTYLLNGGARPLTGGASAGGGDSDDLPDARASRIARAEGLKWPHLGQTYSVEERFSITLFILATKVDENC